MSNWLAQVRTAKQAEIARQQSAVPLDSLKETIETLGRPRNFFSAVTRLPAGKLVNVIVQLAITNQETDAALMARQFADTGADALCVVTDQSSKGRLHDLHAVRDAVRLPVLRRDLILDPYQMYESRAAGADAVLLIAEFLEAGQMIDLQILATELNMTCVIEVHDMENLIRVRDAVIGFPHRSYSLLAINNRELQTEKIDLGTTLRLAELVNDRNVLISEGGIQTRADVKKLAEAGVRAVVVEGSDLR